MGLTNGTTAQNILKRNKYPGPRINVFLKNPDKLIMLSSKRKSYGHILDRQIRLSRSNQKFLIRTQECGSLGFNHFSNSIISFPTKNFSSGPRKQKCGSLGFNYFSNSIVSFPSNKDLHNMKYEIGRRQ